MHLTLSRVNTVDKLLSCQIQINNKTKQFLRVRGQIAPEERRSNALCAFKLVGSISVLDPGPFIFCCHLSPKNGAVLQMPLCDLCNALSKSFSALSFVSWASASVMNGELTRFGYFHAFARARIVIDICLWLFCWTQNLLALTWWQWQSVRIPLCVRRLWFIWWDLAPIHTSV